MSKRPGYSSRHSVTPGQEGGKLREFQKGEEEREEEAYFVRANLLDVGIIVIKKVSQFGNFFSSPPLLLSGIPIFCDHLFVLKTPEKL